MDLDEGDLLSLSAARNLRSLNLNGSRVNDLAPLIGLANLAALSLDNMGLTDEDIVPLRYMANITDLSLNGNQIRDLAPLANLANLASLSAEDNFIRDWSPVEHVTNVTHGLQRHSSIVLPNSRLTYVEREEWVADFLRHGGPTDNELAALRYVNIERANHNLRPVEIDDTLMMAARFYAQQLRDLGGSLGHNFGPYATDPSARHGASANVAAAFGANLRWNGGNGHSSGTSSAESVVRAWMNSDGHRRYILSPEHRFMGFGQYPGGISYMFLSDSASD